MGLFDEVEWNTDVNKPGAKETNAKFKKKYEGLGF